MFGLCLLAASSASAQYYELANQITNMIQPALSGSMRYKGFVDVSGTGGIGTNRANFFGVSTTQGFMYADWFFMGAGVGVDVVTGQDTGYDGNMDQTGPWWSQNATSKTRVMLPVFSDFRFIIGGMTKTSFFIDLKMGASWLLGNRYLELHDQRLNTAAQFYLKPSVGVRIPTNKNNPKQAVNVGLTYQLITSDNNFGWYGNSVTLNNLGATVAYEW